MRLAPSAASSVSPARAYVEQARWLLAPGSVVVGLDVLDAQTVQLTVADQFVADPADRDEADRLAADSARTVLEQAGHGVRLLAVTSTGYVGKVRDLAPAQMTFATGLPGVQRYDLVPEDLDHDGHLAPHEVAHRIEVDSDADVARLDWLLRDRFDEGSVHDGVVRIVVPKQSWFKAPVAGA